MPLTHTYSHLTSHILCLYLCLCVGSHEEAVNLRRLPYGLVLNPARLPLAQLQEAVQHDRNGRVWWNAAQAVKVFDALRQSKDMDYNGEFLRLCAHVLEPGIRNM